MKTTRFTTFLSVTPSTTGHDTATIRQPSSDPDTTITAWTIPNASGFTLSGLLITLLLLSGCGGGNVFHNETSSLDSHANTRTFAEPFEPVWGAMEKAFLAWGFRIDRLDAQSGTLIGTYLLDEDEQTTTLRLSIMARPEAFGTTLFASAVETRHARASGNGYWLFVIPRTKAADTGHVIITTETIYNADFYRRFFNLMEKELGSSGLLTKVNVQ